MDAYTHTTHTRTRATYLDILVLLGAAAASTASPAACRGRGGKAAAKEQIYYCAASACYTFVPFSFTPIPWFKTVRAPPRTRMTHTHR